MRTLIDLAIKDRLIGDLPVAVLCSGGLDSTIVALVAAQSGVPITVLHCLVDELDTEHFRSIKWPSNVTTKEIVLDMSMKSEALRATEEPVDLGSVVPQYALGKAIAEAGFNVVLTGDGADEVFGGYTRARTYDSQYSDIFCELVNYHLPRLDKTMMANTVELRSPFLAHYVIEQALLIPYHQRTRKQALKELYADIVPEHILNREKVPLKTEAVKNGGFEYRKDLVDQFYKQRGML
jgi:asparagine synthase (glutamine-hydrolysing)